MDEFSAQVLSSLLRLYDSGEAFVMEADTKLGRAPVGLAAVAYVQRANETPRAEPRVDWFPWASPRNKLECALRLMIELNRNFLVLTTVREGEERLLHHLCRYGALRYVGRINGFFASEPVARRRAFLFHGRVE